MALSRYERRRLTAIESHLHDDYPDLARRLDTWSTNPWRWPSGVPTFLMVIGAIGVLTGLLTANFIVLAVSGIFPLGVAFRLRRLRRDPGRRRTGPH